MVREKILVTAALPYINNVPHMGHIVGSHLPADIFYRYCRAVGHDTVFVGGSDEHGTPSVVAAKELGISPRQLVDTLHDIHKRVYAKLNIDYTNYSRTSNPSHHEMVRGFFRKINAGGHTHRGEVDMFFCEQDNMFLPDRFILGTCPKCNYDSANADQCESCATVLAPSELRDPQCKSCGTTPVMKKSEHLYLDLDKLAPQLGEWVEKQRAIWRPHVYSEAKKWIDEGLRSRSITRDLDWGVHVPASGLEDKVFYVWFDAPISYMTFTKEIGEGAFEKYWKDPDAKVFHFLGKDNIPFHTIFWPAMLLAHGGLNLPSNVVGYNYLNFEGQKFSKSKGVGVFCYNLLDSDVDIDVLRSYLTTVIPESKDSDFSWDRFKSVTNTELIGKLGNFFNRTLNLAHKNFDGRVGGELSDLTDNDAIVMGAILSEPNSIGELFSRTELREAYKKILQYASVGNAYLERTAPWKLMKEGRVEEAKKTLSIAVNLCKSLAIVASPILPDSMQRLWNTQLNFQGSLSTPGIWSEATKIGIHSDHQTGKQEPLYKQIDDARLTELETSLSKPHSLRELVGGKNA